MILLGWDLINHQQKHVKHTGICPKACSVIFLKAGTQVHPSGIQSISSLLLGKDAQKEFEEREREGGRDRISTYGKMLKIGDSGRDIQALL